MHEMALTRNVVDIVVAEAQKSHATEVRAVHLTIGYARDIVEDIFEKMFAWMARGTVAEHAELVITRVPLTVRCNRCGMVYHIDTFDESTWPCPSCKVKDYRLNSGMEFFISDIEVASDAPRAACGACEARGTRETCETCGTCGICESAPREQTCAVLGA